MTAAPEKFVTKPAHIEAMQWDGTADDAGPIIEWVLSNSEQTASYFDQTETTGGNGYIHLNREFGHDIIEPGDWVCRNTDNPGSGFYSWPGDAFDANYEREVGANDYARIYTDDNGEWRYQVFAGNHRLISASEDGKVDRTGVLRELKREWPHVTNISEERKG